MTRLIARSLTLALATVLTGGVALPAHAAPQSDGASRMSQASLEASIEVPVAVIHALAMAPPRWSPAWQWWPAAWR